MSAWRGHDVPAVAALLAEDHADAWHQVAAWQRTADLLLYHSDTLTGLRERVVAAWPPERSPAAAAYVDYLDRLIASLADTREAALSNGAALTGILSTLEDARTRVEAVNREWLWNAATEQRQAGIILPRGPNVTPEWRERLNQQVYEQMTATEQAVFEYTNQLTAPKPYVAAGDLEGPVLGLRNGPVNGFGQVSVPQPGSAGDSALPPHSTEPPPKNSAPVLVSGAPSTEGGATEFSGDSSRTAPFHEDHRLGALAPPIIRLPSEPFDSTGRRGPMSIGARGTTASRGSGNRPPMQSGAPERFAPGGDAAGPAAGRPPRTDPAAAAGEGSSSITPSLAERDSTHVLPGGGMVGGMGVLPTAGRQRLTGRRHRWVTSAGVEPVIGPRRFLESADPGPGVIGIDR